MRNTIILQCFNNTIHIEVPVEQVIWYPRCTSIVLALHRPLNTKLKPDRRLGWRVSEFSTGYVVRRHEDQGKFGGYPTKEEAIKSAFDLLDNETFETIFDDLKKNKI